MCFLDIHLLVFRQLRLVESRTSLTLVFKTGSLKFVVNLRTADVWSQVDYYFAHSPHT